MKATPIRFAEVMAQLDALAAEGDRAMETRRATGANPFESGLGRLRGLAKKIKTNHPLAMQLWASGRADAMLLATMLFDSSQLSEQETEAMLRPLHDDRLVDAFAHAVVAGTAFANVLRVRWINSPVETIGRAGWVLAIAQVARDQTGDLDFDTLLHRLEAEMKHAPKRKQAVMNRCLAEIGSRYPEYRQRCREIGERLGRLDDTPIRKK